MSESVINTDDRLLDVNELAHYLNVKPSWIYEARRAKNIPHMKLGALLRFSRQDVDRWLAEECSPRDM